MWELLILRKGGRCSDARTGKASTRLAFLNIETFFDRVWRHCLLYNRWAASVQGKTFLMFRSYLEVIIVTIIMEGRISNCWESTRCLLPRSILSIPFSAPYASSLQRMFVQADQRARWNTADGHIRRTNCRFHVDDGLFPTETKKHCRKYSTS